MNPKGEPGSRGSPFDGAAEAYARTPPSYPADLFADLQLRPGSRVLEVGCGTGQATADLVASALRPGGRLVTVATNHVKGGSTEFFHRSQRCYERFDPENTPRDLRLKPAAELPDIHDEIDDCPEFGPATYPR